MLMIYLLQLLSLHRRRYQQLKRPVVAVLCSSSMTTTTACTIILLFLIFQQQHHYPSTTSSTAWILRPPITTSIHIQQQQQQQQQYEPFRMKNCRIHSSRCYGSNYYFSYKKQVKHHLLSATVTTEHIDDNNDDDDYTNDNDNENNNNNSKNNNNNNNTNNTNFELWEVGNVDNDFNNLQQAIMYQNSQQDLYHIERINTLTDFALHHKQSIRNTLQKFIILPLLISYIVSQLFNILLQSKSIILNTISKNVLRMIRLVSMTQFWSILIIAPITLLYLVGRQYNRNISIHNNVNNNDDDIDHDDDQYNNLQYLILPTNDSKRSIRTTTSTRNYIQCILEQWVSCVSTVGITTLIYLFFLSKIKSNNTKIPIVINTLLFVQILTRLGSIASIQQYQSLYYTLLHKHQTQPISWNVWSLQQLISYANNIRWMIFDITYLSVISKTVQQSVLLLLTSSILLWCSIISSEKWIQQQQQQNNNNDKNNDIIVQYRIRANQLILQVQQFTNFILKFIFPLSIWFCYQQGIFHMIRKILLSHNNNKVISMTTVYLFTALIGPICHLIAICKIIKVRYTHNASLAMNENEFQHHFNSPDKWKWRYMIQWRQPQRILITIQQYWQQIWYWLFVRGSVEEQLQQDRRQQIRGTTIKSHRSIILQKVADESLSSPMQDSVNQQDRTKWKELAMQRIAQKHQDDYERGTYDDPLGVAVYRTLGIGLGFNYDHMSTLNSTQTPSIRRLQARAAKSAIRRVNELYNADVARQTLEQIADPVERSKRATAMRQEAEMEVQQLATKLADLIPIDQTSDVSGSPLQIEQYNTGSYMHTSKHQYTLPSLQTESPALKKLFNEYIVHKNDTKPETYDIDYLNPMDESDQSSDDEYITEWLNKYRYSGFVNKDDDGNTIETMLV